MACDSLIWGLLIFGCSVQALLAASEDNPLEYMSKEEREALKFVLLLCNYILYQRYDFCMFDTCVILIIGKKPGICFIMLIMLIW